MERLRVSARRSASTRRACRREAAASRPASVLFHRRHDDRGVAALEVGRADDGRSCWATCARARRPGAAQDDRVGLRGLPARRVHDAAVDARTGCCSRTWTSPGATTTRRVAVAPEPARYVASGAGRRPRGGRLPRVREPVDPAPRPRDRRSACSSASRRWSEVSFEAQNRTFDTAEESRGRRAA